MRHSPSTRGERSSALWGGKGDERRRRPGSLFIVFSVAASLLALGGGLAAPAGKADRGKAHVQPSVRKSAEQNPDGTFRVIVESRRSDAAALEQAVDKARRDKPGKARGIAKKFTAISAVAAELTGSQIDELADDPEVFAITEDARTVSTYSNSQLWVGATEITEEVSLATCQPAAETANL